MATTLPGYDSSQALYGYDINPSPQSGTGAYGTVPGAIGIPPSTYDQVSGVYPGLGAQAGQISSNVSNELAGQLSPDTIAALQQHAAQFGASSGMPGSGFAGNAGLRSLGLNVEAVKQQGQKDYLSALQGIGATQTPQSLAAEIASRNATLAAAPNPTLSAQQQMADWMNKFLMTQLYSRNPGGGTGGRTGGGSGTDPVQQQMQQMLNGPNSTNWFYQPNNTAAGTPSYNPNRIPPPATDQNQQYDEYEKPLFGYDPAQDPNSWDMFGQGGSTGGSGGYSSYEGTPWSYYDNGNWSNDTYTTPDASYYDPYQLGAYGDYGGGE